jgi:hypothetical protein
MEDKVIMGRNVGKRYRQSPLIPILWDLVILPIGPPTFSITLPTKIGTTPKRRSIVPQKILDDRIVTEFYVFGVGKKRFVIRLQSSISDELSMNKWAL